MADYLAVLLPSIGVGLIFWFVMRSVMRADRGEREAEKTAREDAEQWYQEVRAREGHDIADTPPRAERHQKHTKPTNPAE